MLHHNIALIIYLQISKLLWTFLRTGSDDRAVVPVVWGPPSKRLCLNEKNMQQFYGQLEATSQQNWVVVLNAVVTFPCM